MEKRKRAAGPLPARSHLTPRGLEREATPARAGVTLAEVESEEALPYVAGLIREIPDFPQAGIVFKDITPLLADPRAFHIVLDAIAHRLIGVPLDAIVGIESRGFIFGAALAARLNTSFVPVRKPGKLPAASDTVSYSLEYGEAELQMHRDALDDDARVVIVDDLLATGGTAAAAAELVERQGGVVEAFAFVIELEGLKGRARLGTRPVITVLKYD